MSNTIKPVDNAMLTKITDKIGNAKETGSTAAAKSADNAASRAEPGKTSDTVELTSGAKLLERLEKTLAAMPEIDAGRVEAVKSAIASGDYQIDAEKIADALLRTDRELG